MKDQDRGNQRQSTHRLAPIDPAEPDGERSVIEARCHDHHEPEAEMLREAVAEYTVRHAPRRRPRSVGAFKSGRRDLGRRAEALLAGFGEQR